MTARKRRPSLSADQLGFTFTTPMLPRGDAALAGLGAQVAAAVGLALKEETRSRFEIAGAMSALLGEDVSKWMLDGYASEARDAVNISFVRFLALIAVTNRHDLLDAHLRRIGVMALVGEEALLARLGDLDAREQNIKTERRHLMATVQPMNRPETKGQAR